MGIALSNPAAAPHAADQRRAIGLAIAAIGGLFLVRLVALIAAPLPLAGDEAQYWSWAQDLRLVYSTKPPLIAWTIAAATGLFGDASWAIRLPALIAQHAAALILIAVGWRLADARTGAWSGVMYALLPGITLSASVMTTDALMMALWAAALYAFIRAIEERRWAWWLATGVLIGLSGLAKYTGLFAVLSAGLYLLLAPQGRRHLTTAGPYLALAATALVLAPNVIGVLASGGQAFGDVAGNAAWTFALTENVTDLAEFWGTQFGIFGPLLAGALVLATVRVRRLGREDRSDMHGAGVLLAFTWPLIAVMSGQALLGGAQANWAAPAYIGATVFVVRACLVDGARWALTASAALHAAILALFLAGPAVDRQVPLITQLGTDPFKQMRDGPEIARLVGELDAAHAPDLFAFASRYDLAYARYYGGLPADRVRAVAPGGHTNFFDGERVIRAPVDRRTILIAPDHFTSDGVTAVLGPNRLLGAATLNAGQPYAEDRSVFLSPP